MILTFFTRCIIWCGAVNISRGAWIALFAVAPRADIAMTDPVFLQAYATVRRSFSDEQWAALTPRQITDAIYREMRRIDAIRAAEASKITRRDKG